MDRIDFTTYSSELKKNDIILFNKGQERLFVVDTEDNETYQEITAYLYPEGNWLITLLRFVWIKIRYRITKLWRWIRTRA